jgi:hypothetical protein
MKDKIQKAFDAAHLMAVLSSQKQILKEEFTQSLCYFEHGGCFTVSKELINFLKTLKDFDQVTDVILIDDNQTPITIPNLADFFEKVMARYFESVNAYYTKYATLTKNRTIEGIINL